MKKIASLFLIILTFTNCIEKSNVNNKKNKISEKNSNYILNDYDTLPNLKLPIKWTPEIWSEICSKYIETTGNIIDNDILKYPFAKVFSTENFNGVIFVSNGEANAPVFITIDKFGQPIDSLILLGDWGNNDPSINTKEQVIIKSNYSIKLIDSISYYQTDSEGRRIENSIEKSIKLEEYKINKIGKIKKASS